MVPAHWTILQMHSDFAKVRKHKQMDMMKSTQRVMERYNYHCSAILCSSGQSILHFWACQISYGKCPLKHIANARAFAIWFYSEKNITKWTWWNQHNEWWKGTTITARPSCVPIAGINIIMTGKCIYNHIFIFGLPGAHFQSPGARMYEGLIHG